MELQLPAVLTANSAFQRQAHRAVGPRTPAPARRLVVLSCMDARLDLFRALGLEVGDAHLLRNAGGRATADAIRSLIVSTHLLGTREVGVVHHTDCGLEGRTDDDIAAATGVTDVEFLAFAGVEQSVHEDVEVIRSCGRLPPGVVVWGAVYDVDTAAVTVVDQPSSS